MVRWRTGTFIWPPENLDDRVGVAIVAAFVKAIDNGDLAYCMYLVAELRNCSPAFSREEASTDPIDVRYVAATVPKDAELGQLLPKKY